MQRPALRLLSITSHGGKEIQCCGDDRRKLQRVGAHKAHSEAGPRAPDDSGKVCSVPGTPTCEWGKSSEVFGAWVLQAVVREEEKVQHGPCRP